MSEPKTLEKFSQFLKKVPDPRSKRGVSHPFPTILAIVFIGLLGNITTPAGLARWGKLHFEQLKKFLHFGKPRAGQTSAPCDNTYTRVLRKLSLENLQNAFAEFINALVTDTTIVGAVDGKTAKQMKDEDGNPLVMLNVFAHQLKVHLASWSVDGDKTNEPGCLKKHLAELFEMYPCLQLLTGDAIYAQRPLLEAIREYERDYLFCVKENQPKVLEKMKETFQDAPEQKPHDRTVSKKRGLLRYGLSG